MDSMRSLNKSLPPSPSKQRRGQPPEQLLQAFKAAALSVTTLYKTAASDQAGARAAGYQDALDDILAFLDKEHLGLGDGEGWKVRRWATERLDGSPVSTGNESDEDRGDTNNQARGSSPLLQRGEVLYGRQASRPPSPVRTVSTASQTSAPIQQPNASAAPRPEVFTFTSPLPYPQDMDVQPSDPALSNASQIDSHPPNPSNSTTSTVRLEVVPPRGSRTPLRNSNHPGRHNARNSNAIRSLGSGAGSKRRVQFADYFDLGNLGDGRDTHGGGGKRGRYS